MKRLSIVLALAMGCTVSTKDEEFDLDVEATSDTSADGFGPYQGGFEVCDEEGVGGFVTRRTPYHFWSFETDGCDDAFIDLASRDGDDTFLLLYQLTSRGWALVDLNDDCATGGTLNSCLDGPLEAGEYLVGASTYEFMRRRQRVDASYVLNVTCRDEGACGPVTRACGSRGLEPCGDGEYCAFPESAICGRADAPGVCTPVPEVCPAVAMPVCGCDGRSYGNSCEAAVHGISVDYQGFCGADEGEQCGGIAGTMCRGDLSCDMSDNDFCGADLAGVCRVFGAGLCPGVEDPVCGCDGVTYSNDCMRREAHVALDRAGECDRPGNGEGEICGGIAGFLCEDGLRCDMSANRFCGADLAGTCEVDEPSFCPTVVIPVCGCDGRTYNNDCERIGAGVPFNHDGPC